MMMRIMMMIGDHDVEDDDDDDSDDDSIIPSAVAVERSLLNDAPLRIEFIIMVMVKS
jgi:hypothetical protein